MARRLELVLRGFGGALDGAQEANLRGDGRDDFVLLRLTRFVLRLEILQERLQIVTGLLHFRIQRVDFSRERIRSQRLLFLDQLGLLFVAQVDVFGAARRAEVLARPRLERLKVAERKRPIFGETAATNPPPVARSPRAARSERCIVTYQGA